MNWVWIIYGQNQIFQFSMAEEPVDETCILKPIDLCKIKIIIED